MSRTGTAGHVEIAPLRAVDLRRVVTVLCFTEIVSWGVLFYAFPVLATTMAGREQWPFTWLVAIFTLAQLVAATAGIWVGRHLDRHGPRGVMTAGSVLAVVSIAAVALAPSLPLLTVAWVLVGLAMSATLYPPAFAAVTHWGGEHRVRALTAVTLVAGFASTVFAPLTALLVTELGWRQSYLVLAAVLLATVPAHWWGLRAPWRATTAATDTTDDEPAPDVAPGPGRADVVRQPEFVLLALAMTISGFCVYAVVINLVPLLAENGLSTGQAAVALGIGGAGQVAGRLVYAPFLARIAVRPRTMAVLGAASLTTLALAVFSGSMLAACVTSFAAGVARGIFTLIQATAVTDRWGTTAYGARSSILSGGVMTAAAFAPWAGALLAAGLGSYTLAFVLLAVGAALSAFLVRPVAVAAARPVPEE